MTMITKYKDFMLESNKIEGENRLNPNDIEAVEFVINNGIYNIDDILILHSILGKYLKVSWVGKLRDCYVRVGNHECPPPASVHYLMDNFIENLYNMNSWEAHNAFESIHPFRDLNGRTGRLIWLSKAIYEGYNFKMPFLQAYYYQTLQDWEKNEV